MAKHYITVKNGMIIDGFSDEFREPEKNGYLH